MNIICDTILNLYIEDCKEIKCDFILFSDDNNIFAKGKAIIKKGDNDIIIYGDMNDINLNSQTNNIKIINISDIPTDYKCILMNLPKENRRDEVLGDIQIKFPRVKISPSLSLSMYPDKCSFKGEIQPLYTYKKGDVMTIFIEDYTEITTYNLLDNYKDNWEVQFKVPSVDIWCDYNMKTSSLKSIIALHQMNVKWRYKIV